MSEYYRTYSPQLSSAGALVSLTGQLLPSAALTRRRPPVRRFVMALDQLIRQGLFGSPAAA
jgi:hypothetical protein